MVARRADAKRRSDGRKERGLSDDPKTLTHVWRRRTLRGASSSVGQMALPLGLPASYPHSVRHPPSARVSFRIIT